MPAPKGRSRSTAAASSQLSARDAIKGRPRYAYRALRKEEAATGTLRMPQGGWADLNKSEKRVQVITHVGHGNELGAYHSACVSATTSENCAFEIAVNRSHLYGDEPVIIRIDLQAMSHDSVVPLNQPEVAVRYFHPEDLFS